MSTKTRKADSYQPSRALPTSFIPFQHNALGRQPEQTPTRFGNGPKCRKSFPKRVADEAVSRLISRSTHPLGKDGFGVVRTGTIKTSWRDTTMKATRSLLAAMVFGTVIGASQSN